MLKIYITRKKGSSYHFLPEYAQWSDKNAELWLKKGDLGVPVPHRRAREQPARLSRGLGVQAGPQDACTSDYFAQE